MAQVLNKVARVFLGLIFTGLFMGAQAGAADFRSLTVSHVDLDQFMGPWYVQGHTPLVIDAHSSNQIESYARNPDGSIATTFTFYRLGQKITLKPRGWVADASTNAHWKMQFVAPFTSDYLITRLADDYSTTVISVPGKFLIWIMSRQPNMSEAQYLNIIKELAADGYPVGLIRRVPQRW